MADETIIISFQIEAGESEQTLVKLKQQMQGLKTENEAVRESFKAGKISQDEYVAQLAANEKQQRILKVEMQSVTNVVNAQAKATLNSAKADGTKGGSIVEMRNQLKLLNGAYVNMTKAERESADGKALKDKTASLTAELKTLEGELGQNQRNVGNYTNSILDAFGMISPELGALANGWKNLTSFTETAAEVQKGTAAIMGTTTVATEAQATANVGLGSSAIVSAKGFDILKLSLLSNPITLVAVAVVSLITYLTQFDGAMDGLKQGWAGLQAAAKPLIASIGMIGKVLYDAVTIYIKPFQVAFTTLGKVLTGDFSGALDAVKTGFDEFLGLFGQLADDAEAAKVNLMGLGGAMINAASAAAELEKQMQDLEDTQALFSVSQIKAAKVIEQLERQADDRVRSKTERVDLLNEAQARAIALAEEKAKIDAEAANVAVRSILKNAGYAEKYWNQSQKFNSKDIDDWSKKIKRLSDEGRLLGDLGVHLKELADAQALQVAAENELQDVQLDYAAKSSKLRKGIADEEDARVKAAQERTKKQVADNAAAAKAAQEAGIKQLELAAKLANMDAELAKGLDAKLAAQKLAIEAELKLALAQTDSEQMRVRLRAKANADIQALDVAHHKTLADMMLAQAEKNATDLATEQAGAMQIRKNYHDLAMQDLRAQFDAEQISKAEFDQLSLEADLLFYQKELEQANLSAQQRIELEQNVADKKRDIKQKSANEQAAIDRAQISIAKSSAKALTSLMMIAGGQASEMGEFQKAMALFSIGVNTAEAIAGVTAAAATFSKDPVTFGVTLAAGIATVLTNVGQAMALVSGASTPAPPSFERGGYISGPGHNAGGVMINAQGGEMIMNRGASRMAMPMLNALNAAGNGDALAMARISGANQNAQVAQMAAIIAAAPPQVLNVVDFQRVNTDTVRVRDNARLTQV